MEKRIQIATHFTIDPAKEVLGAINYPAKATVTLVVGDQIDASKVDFDVAFTPEQKAKIEEKLNALILEAGRTAKPVASTSGPAVDTSQGGATQQAPVAEEEETISLF